MPFYEVHIHKTDELVGRMVIKAVNPREARNAALEAAEKDHDDVVEYSEWEDEWIQLGEVGSPEEPEFNFYGAYWDADLSKWTTTKPHLFANEEGAPVGNPKRLGRSVDWTPYEDRYRGVPTGPGQRAENWTPPKIEWQVNDTVDAYDLQECPWCASDMEHEGDFEEWVSYCKNCDGTISLTTMQESKITDIEPPSQKWTPDLADFSAQAESYSLAELTDIRMRLQAIEDLDEEELTDEVMANYLNLESRLFDLTGSFGAESFEANIFTDMMPPMVQKCDLCPWHGDSENFNYHIAYDCPGTISHRAMLVKAHESGFAAEEEMQDFSDEQLDDMFGILDLDQLQMMGYDNVHQVADRDELGDLLMAIEEDFSNLDREEKIEELRSIGAFEDQDLVDEVKFFKYNKKRLGAESVRLTPTQRNFIKWLDSQKDDDSYSNSYYLGDGWAQVEPANRQIITGGDKWIGRLQCPHPPITRRTLTSLIDKGLITVINNRDGSIVSSSNPPDRYFIGKAKLNAQSFSAEEPTPKQLVEQFRETVREAVHTLIKTIDDSPNPQLVTHETLKSLVDTAFQLGYNSGNIDGKWEMKKDMMRGYAAEGIELDTPIVDRAMRLHMMIERATRHAMFTAMQQQALLAMLHEQGPWIEHEAEEIDFDWTPEEFGRIEPKELVSEIADMEDHLGDLENQYEDALDEDNEDLEYILEEKIIECQEDIEYLIHLLYEVEAYSFAHEEEEELI